MIKIIITFLFYICLLLNTNLTANENDGKLRVGLLAPFSGEYKNLGESLLLSTQLALDEIDNSKDSPKLLCSPEKGASKPILSFPSFSSANKFALNNSNI